MATKTKVTKDSALKAAKTTKAAPSSLTIEKKVASKKETSVASPQETIPVEASKLTKASLKAESQAPTNAPVKEGKLIHKLPEKSEKMIPVKEQSAPQATTVVPQNQKWQEISLILEKLKEDTIREIRKSVKNGTEAVAAIEPGGDIYDQASSERDRELGLLLGDREREKIHSIDEALLRIDEGDYGICEECDEDIPLGRLKAMPFTRHCVKCKSDLEKLQAQTKRVEEDRAYREIPLGSEEEE